MELKKHFKNNNLKLKKKFYHSLLNEYVFKSL